MSTEQFTDRHGRRWRRSIYADDSKSRWYGLLDADAEIAVDVKLDGNPQPLIEDAPEGAPD